MRVSVAGVIAALGLATAANATTIMQTQSFGPATPNFSSTLTFNKYTGLASDIVSVKVKIQLDISGGLLELDNDGANGASGTAELGATAGISSSDVSLLDNLFQPVTGVASASNATGFSIAGNDGDAIGSFQAGGLDYFLFNGSAAADMKMGFINTLFHGQYAGGGTFDILLDANQIFEFGAIGGIAFAGSPVTASGNVMIIYEVIPTPSAAALLGLGGLLVARRRR